MTRSVAPNPHGSIDELHEEYRRAVGSKRFNTFVVGGAILAAAVLASLPGEVDLARFWSGLPRLGSYIRDILPTLTVANLPADISEWFWGFDKWLLLLGDTLLVAYVGTALGAVFGCCLCFVASANLTRSRAARIAARRTLEFCRTVPEIVFALMFVYAFGLGPVAGVLAIAIHTTGALGKLFAEVVENIDMNPVEGVAATGGSWLETVRFAVLPQVASNFASYTLLRFEINVRGSTVLGFVGAGGIGKELISAIRQFYYTDVSAILLMIVLTVIVIDMATETLRHRLIGLEAKP
jgi:phosphonate transport system permease protein